jgi:MoxR-like ATPase
VACLLAGGHLLIEDVPGVGKTTLAHALARSFGLHFSRVQFTADLMPSDLSGVSIYERGKEAFVFHPGPIFAQVLLADEINRASPKTQSALLEAMEEGSVTVDGVTRRLPEPFGVIGTQNPVEHEGTYPLPHAELDRFMIKMSLGYPDGEAEVDLLRLSADPVADLEPVVSIAELVRMLRLVEEVYASEAVLRYVVSVTGATREHEAVYLGASPRASRMLLAASRAHAATRGRSYCIPDDVKDLAPHVLSHRIIASPGASYGGPRNGSRGEHDKASAVVREILSSVPVNEAV